MSGDLEDFLKRAAERRQAKAAQQKQSAPQKRVPPQYSDRRTERAPRPLHDAEVVEAEVVEAQVVSASSADKVVVAQAMTENQRSSKQAIRPVRQKVAKSNAAVPSRLAREAKASSKVFSADNSNSMPYAEPTATNGSQQSTGLSAEDLIAMLKRPGGVQQAILLREILDRPEHRW
ncbi:MAG TPA: hypothetical protein DEF45_25565 [Rhodopirellula sp.]|nr:hypothetical protein [Rhodopirellula sp.]